MPEDASSVFVRDTRLRNPKKVKGKGLFMGSAYYEIFTGKTGDNGLSFSFPGVGGICTMCWRIADVHIRNRVVLAPMAGITDLACRLVAKEFGCGLVYGPLISAKAIQFRNPNTEQLLMIAEEERPVALQIFGSDPATMAEAARYVADIGPDTIDINMGCPTPKVVDHDDGCALMLEPVKAARVIEAVVRAVTVPVTVKIRKGWDEEHVTAVELACLAEQAGATAVCIHGRTREQFFSGEVDWSIIAAVKAAVRIPVIGNGDVKSASDAERMLRETGCDAVMIGRAGLGNPWVFSQTAHYLKSGEMLPDPTPEERVEMALRHFRLALEFKGERVVYEMRKQLTWYLKGLPYANQVKRKIMVTETPEAVMGILEDYRHHISLGLAAIAKQEGI